MEKTLLMIEDDVDTVSILEFILADAGYRVISSNGDGISALVAKHSPDLILLDNWLDGVTGHDICKQLKSSPVTAHIPVILLSATFNLAETARSCHADAYVSKPFDLEGLLATVAEYLIN